MTTNESLRRFLADLDGPHLAYAEKVGDELSLGDPAPDTTGLDSELVREIRRQLTREWRSKIKAAAGRRREQLNRGRS